MGSWIDKLSGADKYTYGEAVEKYRNRIRKCKDLGIEPRATDVDKLMAYVDLAERKGRNTKRDTKSLAEQKFKTAQPVVLNILLERAEKLLGI